MQSDEKRISIANAALMLDPQFNKCINEHSKVEDIPDMYPDEPWMSVCTHKGVLEAFSDNKEMPKIIFDFECKDSNAINCIQNSDERFHAKVFKCVKQFSDRDDFSRKKKLFSGKICIQGEK